MFLSIEIYALPGMALCKLALCKLALYKLAIWLRPSKGALRGDHQGLEQLRRPKRCARRSWLSELETQE
jgi:hypothetical protein